MLLFTSTGMRDYAFANGLGMLAPIALSVRDAVQFAHQKCPERDALQHRLGFGPWALSVVLVTAVVLQVLGSKMSAQAQLRARCGCKAFVLRRRCSG